MRVLTIVHDEDAGPGVFADVLTAGAAVDTWWASADQQPPAAADAYDAIVSFGGAAHPHHDDRNPWLATEKRFLADALRERVPLLGVCLGAELIAEAEGAWSRRMARPEIGWFEVTLTAAGIDDPVLGPAGQSFQALEWHSYEVSLPARATELARGANCLQAYRIGKHAWGIQFHAEVTSADFQSWLEDYAEDEEAVAAGLDPVAVAAETRERITAWHELGRGICERFMVVAAAR